MTPENRTMRDFDGCRIGPTRSSLAIESSAVGDHKSAGEWAALSLLTPQAVKTRDPPPPVTLWLSTYDPPLSAHRDRAIPTGFHLS
ncbi:hypothetical protein PMIN01_02964 [Paraphaeosphaeria minitans]|uniref:Uncharacterized protein n=1 Tax=Paraphaeosphaeria minitans TaxID=565426 RepID=A0A9P6GU98_9PLEO|nr:hypothetical protein PMIN01_02964 [Paraphaeosphaeria minitans]